MSLTSHLRNKNSPICKFLTEAFPNIKPFLAEARKRVRDAPTAKPIGRVSYGTIGTAIDYRIRYYFGVTQPSQLIAWNGASRTVVLTVETEHGEATVYPADGLQLDKDLVDGFFERLTAFLNDTDPVHRRLTSDEEAELARYCYVLALFDEIARSPSTARRSALFEHKFRNVDELLELPPMIGIDDMCGLSEIFFKGFNDKFDLPATLNPTFSGSPDVGGADGDIILNRTLLDVKTTIKSEISPQWIYQLLGYALLDYDNEYDLTGVGLYMARQGLQIDWSFEEVQNGLAAVPNTPIASLRKQFKSLAQSLSK